MFISYSKYLLHIFVVLQILIKKNLKTEHFKVSLLGSYVSFKNCPSEFLLMPSPKEKEIDHLRETCLYYFSWNLLYLRTIQRLGSVSPFEQIH